MADREGDGDEISIGGPQAPEYLRPVYANYATVNHTPWDFRLTFALIRTPTPGPEAEAAATKGGEVTPEVVSEIILPANLMHGFISALRGNFDRYLESFGMPGITPEGPEPSGGDG